MFAVMGLPVTVGGLFGAAAQVNEKVLGRSVAWSSQNTNVGILLHSELEFLLKHTSALQILGKRRVSLKKTCNRQYSLLLCHCATCI